MKCTPQCTPVKTKPSQMFDLQGFSNFNCGPDEDYNAERPHKSLGHLPPAEYEKTEPYKTNNLMKYLTSMCI
jgi:hypothetical protein